MDSSEDKGGEVMKRLIILIAVLFTVSAQAEVTKAKSEYTYKARAKLYFDTSTTLVAKMETFLVLPSVRDLQDITRYMKRFNKASLSGSEIGLCYTDDQCKYNLTLAQENGALILELIPLVKETAVEELNL